MVTFPPGRERTPAHRRKRAAFDADLTLHRAVHDVQEEVRRVGGRALVINHDLRTRTDGGIIAGQRRPDDPGVVVYFTLHGVKRYFACDKWDLAQHNLRAIAYTMEAKRAVQRWGCATAEAEYKGYEALPPPGATTGTGPVLRTPRPPHEVLHVAPNAPPEVVRAAFVALAKKLHPDVNGSDGDLMREAIEARNAMLNPKENPQ